MTTTTASHEVYELFEFKPGLHIPVATLRHWLPDVETALFFAKAYQLDYRQLSNLLYRLFNTPVIVALMTGNHSVELQDYLVDTVPTDVWEMDESIFDPDSEHIAAEILPQVWESLSIKIATSIQEVADKVGSLLSTMPSIQGQMVFGHLAKMNVLRGRVGDYQPWVQHQSVADVAVVLDVSGSMTAATIQAIVEDVVQLSRDAKAHLILVSDTAKHWAPNTFSVEDVLAEAEYGGTQYETLLPWFNQDWGTVITIADYDSSQSAKRWLSGASGRIGKLLDISLVSRPTFLAECLGQLADEVEPVLIAQDHVITW